MSEHLVAPDALRAPSEGWEARIRYVSSRSGNEVTRNGEVVAVREVEDGDKPPVVYVLTGRESLTKHTYVALVSAETGNGTACIAAASMTTEATPDPDPESEPSVAPTYVLDHSVARKSHLGVVSLLVRTDTPAIAISRWEDLA